MFMVLSAAAEVMAAPTQSAANEFLFLSKAGIRFVNE